MAITATRGAAGQSSCAGTGGPRVSALDPANTKPQGPRDKIPNFAMLKAVDRRNGNL
jgi:hypothetical protein